MGRSPVRQLLDELKRRRVYRVAVVYMVVAWVLLQLGNIVVEPLQLPAWTMPLLILFLVTGLPVAVVLAWAFEITPEGVRRTTPPGASGSESGVHGEPADGPGATPEAGDVGEGPEGPSGSGRTGASDQPGIELHGKVRTAALVGLGMLIAVLAIGTYAFFQSSPHPAAPTAESEAGSDRATLRSLAVLPFTNTSPDPENEFFADGVTEDILTHLALVPNFSVVSRTTVMRYKESPLTTVELAEELGVRYILAGSVRRAGDQVRITAELVDGITDQSLWARSYDRDLEDIFAVQSEIATAIAGALESELTRGLAARIDQRPTDDLEAYDLFLRGREDFYLYTAEGTERAIQAFRRALERDPGFSLARAWLGRAMAIQSFNHGAGADLGDSALLHARRAVDEEPTLPAAHTALGTALMIVGRYAEAQTALERATELNPNDWAAMGNLGIVYASRGRHDLALRTIRESLERDPARSHLAYQNLSTLYGQLELLEPAWRNLERSLSLDPNHLLSIAQTVWLHAMEGRRDDAMAAAERLWERRDESPQVRILLASVHVRDGNPERTTEVLGPAYEASPTAVNVVLVGVTYGWALRELGRTAEAEQVLADTEIHAGEQIGRGSENTAYPLSLAVVHGIRGEPDDAFRWFHHAIDLGWNRGDLLRWSPLFDELRDDPRFSRVEERVMDSWHRMRNRVLEGG